MATNPQSADSPKASFEDLLGGRILAWVGGVAVVLGVVLFLGMAITRGWIDEPTRVVLAYLGSTALFGLGVWLYERKGQTHAALASVASSVAALYLTTTTATQVYDLVSPGIGLGLAGLIGATATTVAIRWDSRLVGHLGIVGALLAPVLVGAGTSTSSLAFMGIALVATVGVLVWRRWSWLALVAFTVSVPQLLDWVASRHFGFEGGGGVGLTLAILALFWLLYTVAALGYEIRVPTARLRLSSALLTFANVSTVSLTGWAVLHHERMENAATAWVLAVAALCVLVGVVTLHREMSLNIRALLVAFGLVLAAIGLALALSGVALVVAYAGLAVVLALASRSSGAERAWLASLGFLGLSLGHILIFEASPSALRFGVDDLGSAAFVLGLWALAASACALLLEDEGLQGAVTIARRLKKRPAEGEPVAAEPLRLLLGFAPAALLYLGSIAIVDTWGVTATGGQVQTGQVLLSALWAVTGFAALVAGLLRDSRSLRRAGLGLLAVAVLKVFAYDLSQLTAIYRVLSCIALGLLLLAGAFAYQRVRLAGQAR